MSKHHVSLVKRFEENIPPYKGFNHFQVPTKATVDSKIQIHNFQHYIKILSHKDYDHTQNIYFIITSNLDRNFHLQISSALDFTDILLIVYERKQDLLYSQNYYEILKKHEPHVKSCKPTIDTLIQHYKYLYHLEQNNTNQGREVYSCNGFQLT